MTSCFSSSHTNKEAAGEHRCARDPGPLPELLQHPRPAEPHRHPSPHTLVTPLPLHQLTCLPWGSVLINASPASAPLLPSPITPLFITAGDYAAEGQLGVMPSPSAPLMVSTACWISNSGTALEAPHCRLISLSTWSSPSSLSDPRIQLLPAFRSPQLSYLLSCVFSRSTCLEASPNQSQGHLPSSVLNTSSSRIPPTAPSSHQLNVGPPSDSVMSLSRIPISYDCKFLDSGDWASPLIPHGAELQTFKTS